MITLSDTKYGSKRKTIISGFSQWDNLSGSATVLFYVQILDANGDLLDDKSVNQNRQVIYNLNNSNRVDASFNPVATGGTGEYDYFFNLIQTTPVVTVLIQLGTVLKNRGTFE
jgi:hypothetical protein